MPSEVAAIPRAVRRVVHSATKSPPSIDVYEVTPERHHKLRVVSSELYSVWVHQSARRPLPCYGDHDHECEHHRLPLRQQHYLFVEEMDSPRLRILRLTSGLVYQVLPELTEVGRNLNGLCLELWRQYSSKADSPLLGSIVKEECVDVVVRDVPDLSWAIERMLTAPDRLRPWSRRRPSAPPPRPRSSEGSSGGVPRAQMDLFTAADKALRRGDKAAADEFLRQASEFRSQEVPNERP